MTDKEILNLCNRSFEPRETMKQIVMFGKDKFMDWKMDCRVTSITNDDDECVGIVMKLNHTNYSDLILISLGWDDTYNVFFLNENSDKTHNIDNVYFDCLFETINNHINKSKFEFCMN